MTPLIVCLFFAALSCFLLLRQRSIEKGKARKIKKNTFIIDGKKKVLTNEMVKEVISKKYGTGSWYKKRPGKNKGL